MDRKKLLLEAINAALKGGEEILSVYDSEFAVEHKDDKSPLTEADKRAHIAITKHLTATGLPILSEEGKAMEYSERKNWKQFWMVDPLDGTKEFVKRNGEFTVNIALIEDGHSTMGVIYVPVTKELYFADDKAHKVENFNSAANSLEELIDRSTQLPVAQNRTNYIVVGSRSHMSEETEAFINEQKEKHQKVDILSKGSSLKLCMVAEGKADAYPRFAPTMEWDTAAGQAIVNGSGAQVINWETQEPMLYNKENLLNSWFLVKR
ncbi:MAG: 3'(2'),5'-bisphosphate nucleotidase CysQ [Vicingus serpentipes]|nr:3'(2'),5'-bisphosphate nucleotidase CysQ [Vicingus serpentipes]